MPFGRFATGQGRDLGPHLAEPIVSRETTKAVASKRPHSICASEISLLYSCSAYGVRSLACYRFGSLSIQLQKKFVSHRGTERGEAKGNFSFSIFHLSSKKNKKATCVNYKWQMANEQ
jgi:hypothetical protein